jgi:hypothetical protein
MNIVRIAGWLATTVLAVAVGLSSLVIANQSKNPAISIALGVGPQGSAKANLAVAAYSARVSRNPKAAVTVAEREMARDAYRNEPLSPTAVGIIAASMRRPAEATRRVDLLDLAGRLSRRNSLVAMQILEVASHDGDSRKFFTWLSRSISTNDERRTLYVGAMADATAREDSVEALVPVIGQSPPWEETYWLQVVRRPASLVNAARIRVGIAGKPWEQTAIKATDRDLAMKLAEIGEFDAVRRLGVALGQSVAEGGAGGSLLINGNFARLPQLPPLDWKLTALGNLGASISPKEKILAISAIGGARGIAARQLIRLPGGHYSFGWTQSSIAPVAPGALIARIRCGEPKSDPLSGATIPLVVGKRIAPIQIPSDGCIWRWISIEVAVADDSAGIDAILRNLSLVPAAGKAVHNPPRQL